MHRAVALLAALIAAAGIGSCGSDGGAEPGAPSGAARALTLVLDFQPNAVHAGIYTALERGYFADAGIDPTIREPGASTDAPKLLRAGRADLAILDIHDLALARARGADLVGVGAIVQRPLAAVIAGDRHRVRTPADLEGGHVGVTGLPSDDAVLDTVLASGGADPATVKRVTIGFDSVAALSSGRVDAATAFWNAEGVELERRGIPVRIFPVDRYGAPPYPELVLTTTRAELQREPDLIAGALAAIRRGTRQASTHRGAGIDALLSAVPGLDRASQRAQLAALLRSHAFTPPLTLRTAVLRRWARFEVTHGIVARRPNVNRAFAGPAGTD